MYSGVPNKTTCPRSAGLTDRRARARGLAGTDATGRKGAWKPIRSVSVLPWGRETECTGQRATSTPGEVHHDGKGGTESLSHKHGSEDARYIVPELRST